MLCLDEKSEPDFAQLAAWRADTELASLLLRSPSQADEALTRKWWEECRSDSSQFTAQIVHKTDNCFETVGIARLMFIDQKASNAELGLFIGESSERGKGLGKKAVEALLKIGFFRYQLKKVFLRVAADNQVAMSLYERVGFKREGILKQHISREAGFVDLILMAIFVVDFQ
ncbi:MAG: GNAT family protein [Pseudomonadota bacterium]